MALKDKINHDLKAALLDGDRLTSEVIRGLKATIHNEEVAQGKRDEDLDDGAIEQLIVKEVKKRNESANIYDSAKRPELAKKERVEAAVLSGYLPEQLNEGQINDVINRVIGNLGVSDFSAMGQVIGVVKNELGNTADGAIIAKLVKKALNSNKEE